MDFNYGDNDKIKGDTRFASLSSPTNSSTTSFTNLRLYDNDPNFLPSAVGYDTTTGILTAPWKWSTALL